MVLAQPLLVLLLASWHLTISYDQPRGLGRVNPRWADPPISLSQGSLQVSVTQIRGQGAEGSGLPAGACPACPALPGAELSGLGRGVLSPKSPGAAGSLGPSRILRPTRLDLTALPAAALLPVQSTLRALSLPPSPLPYFPFPLLPLLSP